MVGRGDGGRAMRPRRAGRRRDVVGRDSAGRDSVSRDSVGHRSNEATVGRGDGGRARRPRGTERRSRQRRSRQRQSRQRRSSVETASAIGRASIQFETPLPVHRARGADAFLRDQDVCRAVGPKRSGGVQIGVIDAGRLQRGGRQVAADRLKRTGGGTEEVRRSAVWRTLAAEVVWTAAGPGWSGGGDLAAAGRLRP